MKVPSSSHNPHSPFCMSEWKLWCYCYTYCPSRSSSPPPRLCSAMLLVRTSTDDLWSNRSVGPWLGGCGIIYLLTVAHRADCIIIHFCYYRPTLLSISTLPCKAYYFIIY
ncbi:hypothetical protein F5B18DRAFT_609727 [Nemania serpens]|nr:hypothetical protein F5B18DRAFT_609727 [Nemania serpens]